MSDLIINDFNGLRFDLTNNKFYNEIIGYGIELIPITGHPVKIPGYGYNNGEYSSSLDLVLEWDYGFEKSFNISDCQKIK
jgi:hypothetical protein